MSDFVAQAAAFKPANSLSWLSDYQQQQTALWSETAFPHRKTENWKYTSLRSLETGTYFSAEGAHSSLSTQEQALVEIKELNSVDLVFVNGLFDAELSTSLDVLPNGVSVVRFADASDEAQEKIRTSLGSVAHDSAHLFVTLNASQLSDGVYIQVDRNAVVETPIRVVQYSKAQNDGFTIAPRIFVDAHEGSQATVIEQFVSGESEQNGFVNAVCELNLQANAKLNHYRLHLEHESLVHIGGVHANLDRDSVLDSFQLALGGKLKRIDVVVNHQGKGAHCELNGVYLPSNKQHVDFHTCIEHAVPHCTTNEVFRGIVSDSAKAVFNGRIHIHKDAQKTLAQLSNKNLLTSNKAEVDTKPELEIYADDVQCAHGATVAQLDDNSMHYLQTRGVSKEEALVMLSFGFINELISQIKHEAIGDYLRPKLAKLFARDPELLRHIA